MPKSEAKSAEGAMKVDSTETDGGNGSAGGTQEDKEVGHIATEVADAAQWFATAPARSLGSTDNSRVECAPRTPERGARPRERAAVAASPEPCALVEQSDDDMPDWLREAAQQLRGPRNKSRGAATRREKARVEARAQARQAAVIKVQRAWRTHHVRVAREQRAAEDAEALERRQQEARARLDAREEEERRKERERRQERREVPACELESKEVGRSKHRKERRADRAVLGAESQTKEASGVAGVLRRQKAALETTPASGAVAADAEIEFELRDGRICVKGCVKPFPVSDATWKDVPRVYPRRPCRPKSEWRATADAAAKVVEASRRGEAAGEAASTLALRCEALEADLERQSEAMTAAWTAEVDALRAEMERQRKRAEEMAAERDEAVCALALQQAEAETRRRQEVAAAEQQVQEEEVLEDRRSQRVETAEAQNAARDEALCVGVGTGGRQRKKKRLAQQRRDGRLLEGPPPALSLEAQRAGARQLLESRVGPVQLVEKRLSWQRARYAEEQARRLVLERFPAFVGADDAARRFLEAATAGGITVSMGGKDSRVRLTAADAAVDCSGYGTVDC